MPQGRCREPLRPMIPHFKGQTASASRWSRSPQPWCRMPWRAAPQRGIVDNESAEGLAEAKPGRSENVETVGHAGGGAAGDGACGRERAGAALGIAADHRRHPLHAGSQLRHTPAHHQQEGEREHRSGSGGRIARRRRRGDRRRRGEDGAARRAHLVPGQCRHARRQPGALRDAAL